MLAGQFACSSSNNGAVELSWQLRPSPGPIADGNTCDPFVCCDPGQVGTRPISRIQLDWQVGAAHGAESFDCGLFNGVTGFDVPQGDALLTVSPVCGDAGVADPASYTAPAPTLRMVIGGETVSLGAVEVVLQVSSCEHDAVAGNPCICHP